MKGTIFNVQHFSLHDGPGIRTTVFFKGCPLGCWWCHNPESLRPEKQLLFWPDRCLACGMCLDHCPKGKEVSLVKPTPQHTAPAGEQCHLCGLCAQACPAEALEMSGTEVTVAEVMAQLEKDALFYHQSGGGVTFSGGEPLMQPGFLHSLLKACKGKGWHTALDTCGYAPPEVVTTVLPLVDLFLYDIKHMDDNRHRELAGVSNQGILENLSLLAASGKEVRLRIPVVPGVNDDDAHYHALGRYLQKVKLTKIHLLPYHAIGADKYAQRGMTYPLPDTKPPTQESLDYISRLLSAYGLDIVQGG